MPLSQQEAARKQPFGYVCRACGKCCPHKFIQVNPYEIARMARHLGMSSGAFRAAYTERDGAILRRKEDDACVFLFEGGCSIHPARPLVCRLYPLGRRVAPDGTEVWVRATQHPESKGEYTSDGTIAEFIAAQGALPFMQAADDYAEWVRQAGAMLDAAAPGIDAGPADGDLFDMDSTISDFCAETETAEPHDIEERRILHLKILYTCLSGGKHDG